MIRSGGLVGEGQTDEMWAAQAFWRIRSGGLVGEVLTDEM